MAVALFALFALGLVATTVLVHVVGLTLLLRWVVARIESGDADLNFWPRTWLLVQLVWALLLIHLVAVAIWAAFYRWRAGLPDLETAFYFSGITYTTIGYGDVLLDPRWRALAAIEGLAGIVMCSLSAAFFFAVMSK
ncbi:MAG: two pore domain potassium channel family protein, partial [Gammaproteobacteria bacterium]